MSLQSDFLLGDPCIAQLLSIILEIQSAFNNNPKANQKEIFLEISKALAEVWHDRLLFEYMVLKLTFFCYSKTT